MARETRRLERAAPEAELSRQSGGFYSVYDTMGRLQLQRPLPTGATLAEVDMSRFGKGTYVIKVTDKEGVCYERVVVE